MFCIPKQLANELKQAFRSKEISVESLYEMTSAERHKKFAKYLNDDLTTFVNSKFEQAMIAKKKTALTDWVSNTLNSQEKKYSKNLLEKIQDLDKLGVLDSDGELGFLGDLAARKLGIRVTESEVKNISAQAGKLNKLSDKLDPVLGIPDTQYWVERKKLDDYVNSLVPTHKLKVLTSTVGRGTMLFSVKSPLVNIISNTVQGALQGFHRRIIAKAYRGLNGDFALKYVKKVNEIYQKSGYDISRLDAEWASQVRLGEEVTHAQGAGVVRSIGRFYEDIVFKQLMGAPDVASSSIAFADSADLLSTKIAQGSKKKALEIFKDAIQVQPKTVEGNLVRAQSIADARFSTYTNNSGYSDIAMSIRKLMNRFSGDVRLGDQSMPFVKTPANVVSVAMDSAGVGAFKGLYKLPQAIKAMKEGETALIKDAVGDFTRAGLGLTLATVLAYSINPDDFVGDYDALTVKEGEMARLKNAPYNSVRLGGKWISLDYMGPLASAFVGIMYARKYGQGFEKIAKYMKGAGGQLLRFPGLTEVSEMVSGVKDALARNDIKKTAEGILDEGVAYIRARAIPGIVSDVARGLDSTERITGEDVLSKTMSGIPGLRQRLPEKIDKTTGLPIKGEGLLSTLLFGGRVKSALNSTVISEIDRLNDKNMAPTITEIYKYSERVKGLKAQIGDAMFTEALKFYGSKYGEKATKEINSRIYQRLSDEDKMKRLNSIRDDVIDSMLTKYKYKKPKK